MPTEVVKDADGNTLLRSDWDGELDAVPSTEFAEISSSTPVEVLKVEGLTPNTDYLIEFALFYSDTGGVGNVAINVTEAVDSVLLDDNGGSNGFSPVGLSLTAIAGTAVHDFGLDVALDSQGCFRYASVVGTASNTRFAVTVAQGVTAASDEVRAWGWLRVRKI